MQTRCVGMESALALTEQAPRHDLYALGERCLHESASRRLDGEIYCAVHGFRDINPLDSRARLQAKADGLVLIEPRSEGPFGWVEAPSFTEELKDAQSLLPEGLATFYRDARMVCATALQARGLIDINGRAPEGDFPRPFPERR